MNCKICNEEQTIRTMAMHLKWSHQIKTEEYILKYGEFRPRLINQKELKTKSEIKCKICDEKMIHERQLRHHVTKKHPGTTRKEYVLKYEFNSDKVLCACGCGQETAYIDCGVDESGEKRTFRKYIKGHWDWVKQGYFNHTDKTKEIIKIKSIQRAIDDKGKYGKLRMHSKEALGLRHKNDWVKAIERIETNLNITCINRDKNRPVYKNEIYQYKCLKCNFEWEQTSFYPNCQSCNPPFYNGISNEEKELQDFILNLIPLNKIIFNSRSIINPNEIDIYIPHLKLAIEYNGLLWHSEQLGKLKEYHINKTNAAKNKGIHLIHIFSDEWNNKKNIVKSRLSNILNNTSNSIYARKCEIKEVPTKNKDIFLNNNHIQGKDKSSIKLGLYHNDELVSIMTFGPPRTAIGKTKNMDNQYELVRFCNILNTNVVGGASRLLKHFIKTHKPNKVYSFLDNRWSNNENNIYLKIGFKHISKSEPGYWYSKDCLTRLHRYNFSKRNLEKQGYNIVNKTERQVMDELGYYRIWDCGTTKYEMCC